MQRGDLREEMVRVQGRRAQDAGYFRGQELKFKVYGFEFGIWDLGFGVWGLGFGVRV